ncbi:two component transcriptional regulator, LytTR family [Streptomyces sp. 1222.5]|uniref:LytR/AlgR family response regulator transcription factor n=1 Tax=unclassified Streptomyces TaxID=2593676 RepID=UPI000897812A|nr:MULTISPECIES: response regulator transcription factor [unclassified Streptomyces]PKW11946.1 LytTR family two component transcriptional regulator [Streptomyces sp. 5112.2]SEB66187.1 two component transcriptional regulator, LytTR family [Streptomyces sp. 1222.5]SEE26100.1 two component transcriptional regulator, LytTR family [Streptomyces sp. 2231.1]
MLRVLAVDDEEPALEELLFLLRADPRVRSAEGALAATDALRRLGRAQNGGPGGADHVDVVFLDIHMAGLSGLDVAGLLTGFAAPPRVVFVTAHEDFALRAFDLKAVDYLLKPLRRERLAEAVRRVAELVEADRATRAVPSPPPSSEAAANAGTGAVPGPPRPPASPLADHISVERGGVTRFLPIADITYAEAHGDYARLYTREDSHLVRIPLSTLEERWRARGFVRIHRRHLVSVAGIEELRVDAGSLTVRVGGAVLAVSRRNARELRDLLLSDAKAGRPGNGR